MKPPKRNGSQPANGTQAALNPLLPEEFQGRKYVIKQFIIQPRVILLDENGKEESAILGPQLGMFEAQMGDTVPQFIEKLGAKLRSDG